MNPIQIKSATAQDELPAIATLVAAFRDDPAARWMYPEDEQYRAHFPVFVRLFGGQAFGCGSADVVNGSEAAALWLPPTVQPDESSLAAHLQSSVAEHHRSAVFSLFEQMGRFHPHEPHWYLPLIGVEPVLQGTGRGSALLRRGVRRCDEDGLSAYLEATSERSVPLYEEHGFKVAGEIRSGDSPPIFPMVRSAN